MYRGTTTTLTIGAAPFFCAFFPSEGHVDHWDGKEPIRAVYVHLQCSGSMALAVFAHCICFSVKTEPLDGRDGAVGRAALVGVAGVVRQIRAAKCGNGGLPLAAVSVVHLRSW